MSIILPRELDEKLAASLANEYLHITPSSVTTCYNGMYNSVYFIDSDIGRIVLKVAPDPNIHCMTSEINMLAAEVDALRRAKGLGIPVPEPLAVDESINPRFFFMTYIEGERLCGLTERLDKSETASLRREIGQLTRKIHTLGGDYFGFVGNPALRICCPLCHTVISNLRTGTQNPYIINSTPHTDSPNPHTGWKELMLRLFNAQIADGEKVGFNLPFVTSDGIRALLNRFADVFDDVAEPCLTHGDLWDGNVLVKKDTDGWRVSGIIDWERACYGDGLMENGFANYDRPDPDFLSGYGKTEFTQSELIRCSLYRLSLYLGMSVGHVYRNGANTQPEWMLEAFRDELLWLGTM